ncbi:MAG: amidohydrolase family protein [Bacteroidota bacterium]
MSDTALRSIDIHTHILPKELPDWATRYGPGDWISLHHQEGSCPACAVMMKGKQVFRQIEANCWDEQQRILEVADLGNHVQVLSTVPVLFHYWAPASNALDTSRFLNDHLAEAVHQHKTHFLGLGTVPLQYPDLACLELERCVLDLGLSGIQIGSHVNQWNLNDPALHGFYAKAEQLGASLFVHPWDMVGQDKMDRYWLPWLVGMPAESALAICSMIFGGIFEKFPGLRVAFAHGGGSFPGGLGRIVRGYEARPDLVAVDNPVHPSEYLGKFWVDSLVHDPQMLRYLIEIVGSNRVALGSDYPFPLGEAKAGQLIRSMNLDKEHELDLLYRSALQWLDLGEEQVWSM